MDPNGVTIIAYLFALLAFFAVFVFLCVLFY